MLCKIQYRFIANKMRYIQDTSSVSFKIHSSSMGREPAVR